ncbi:MAG: hypothetical protein ACHQX3_00200 [Nitrospirales bacterium]|jgi:hypothetical protein
MTDFNRRITDDMHAMSYTVGLYVKGTIGMSIMTVVAVLAASILAPSNSAIIVTITGISVPVIAALLALAQRESARGINGRMEQVIAVTGEKRRLEAVVDTLAATTMPEVSHLTSESKAASNAVNTILSEAKKEKS